MTRIDSICSNIDFPTIIKTYYRPQLQRNPYVEDSFLITSLDNSKDVQFNKLNDTIGLKHVNADQNFKKEKDNFDILKEKEELRQLNRISIITNKHSSITFASVFRNNSNPSLNRSIQYESNDNFDFDKRIDSVESFHRF